jgi:cytochrome P450
MKLATEDVRFDLYDHDTFVDPYPVYKRLRDEAPLYYNQEHDYYAVSRFTDVERVILDRDEFISSRGMVLPILKADVAIPDGLFVCEDAPLHTIHRALISRVFTPKRVNEIEPEIRSYCSNALDKFVGAGHFDFAKDLGEQLPMRVIGMIVGIPEEDQAGLRDTFYEALHAATADPDKPPFEALTQSDHLFGDYIDRRVKNPTDDLLTQMIEIEFEDERGVTRRLRREEILTYLNLVASAGFDTTGRLIGWMGKLLADNPDQRKLLVDDPGLIPNAIEEILRLEPPSYHIGRYALADVEIAGQPVPAGSSVIALPGAANRDERRYEDPDRMDVRRNIGRIVTFGLGAHLCLGANLARLEGRVALEEVLMRWPDWTVDESNAKLAVGIEVRGWDTLPVFI